MFFRTTLRILVTLACSVVLSAALDFISDRVNLLERFTTAINDVDFADVWYSFRDPVPVDERITIVNLGHLPRRRIATLLDSIVGCHPRVVAIDAVFDPDGDTIDLDGTKALAEVIRARGDVIVASPLKGPNSNGNDQIEAPSPALQPLVKVGMVSLNISANDPLVGTVRSFDPALNINGKTLLPFGYLVANGYDPYLPPLPDRPDLLIKWSGYGAVRGSTAVFRSYNYSEVLSPSFDKKRLEDKIVIVGYLGELDCAVDPAELFYTPLNKKMIGRSIPDMYGVEVHANIVKMILDNDYIYQSKLTDLCFSLFFTSSLVLSLIWIRKRFSAYYSIVSKVLLIIFIDLFIFCTVSIFVVGGGHFKFMIADGLIVMIFIPDVYEFLDENLFHRVRPF